MLLGDISRKLAAELVTSMLSSQDAQRPRSQYLHEVQHDQIEAWMREMVVQFMNELGDDFGIRNDTIGLAMSYFDRYLSLQPVDKADVQLVTVACILIAAKFGERQMPSLADLEFVCRGKYTAESIRHAEQNVLTHLEWQLQATTPHMFCAHFLFAVVEEPARASLAFRHAEFLIDLSYYVYEVLEFSPCVVGAAALLCSQAQLRQHLRSGCGADHLGEGPNGSTFGRAEIELAACSELSLAHIAHLCSFDEVDLVRCESLLRGYFERHFVQPKRPAAAAERADERADEAELEVEALSACEAVHDVQISVSLSGMAVGDAASDQPAFEQLECAEGAAGKLPPSPDRGSPDSVEALLETSFEPVRFGTLEVLSEELDAAEHAHAGCCS